MMHSALDYTEKKKDKTHTQKKEDYEHAKKKKKKAYKMN
jgi:hypothetical protein